MKKLRVRDMLSLERELPLKILELFAAGLPKTGSA